MRMRTAEVMPPSERRALIEAASPPADRFQTYGEAVAELEDAKRTYALRPRRSPKPVPPMPLGLVVARPRAMSDPTGLAGHARNSFSRHAGTWPMPGGIGFETNAGETIGGFAHPFARVGFTSGFGRQVVAGMRTSPGHCFGPPNAGALERYRIRLERAALGIDPSVLNTPAPGSYDVPSSFGRQLHSRKRSMPAFGFSVGERFVQTSERGACQHPPFREHRSRARMSAHFMLRSDPCSSFRIRQCHCGCPCPSFTFQRRTSSRRCAGQAPTVRKGQAAPASRPSSSCWAGR